MHAHRITHNNPTHMTTHMHAEIYTCMYMHLQKHTHERTPTCPGCRHMQTSVSKSRQRTAAAMEEIARFPRVLAHAKKKNAGLCRTVRTLIINVVWYKWFTYKQLRRTYKYSNTYLSNRTQAMIHSSSQNHTKYENSENEAGVFVVTAMDIQQMVCIIM